MSGSAKWMVGGLAGVCLLGVLASSEVADAGEHGYGALAFSYSKQQYGWAVDYSTKEEAEQAAVAACNKKTGDTSCKLREWFHDHPCGAFAQDGPGRAGGWGVADSPQEAENGALKACKSQSPSPNTCAVKVAACLKH